MSRNKEYKWVAPNIVIEYKKEEKKGNKPSVEEVIRWTYGETWEDINSEEQLKLFAMEYIAERVFGCKKISDKGSFVKYRCTIETPKPHTFEIMLYKGASPKAVFSLGNLLEPIIVFVPQDMFNAYALVWEWNHLLDKEKRKARFRRKFLSEEQIKELWKQYKSMMGNCGLYFNTRKRMETGVAYNPDEISLYILTFTKEKYENLAKEIIDEYLKYKSLV